MRCWTHSEARCTLPRWFPTPATRATSPSQCLPMQQVPICCHIGGGGSFVCSGARSGSLCRLQLHSLWLSASIALTLADTQSDQPVCWACTFEPSRRRCQLGRHLILCRACRQVLVTRRLPSRCTTSSCRRASSPRPKPPATLCAAPRPDRLLVDGQGLCAGHDGTGYSRLGCLQPK